MTHKTERAGEKATDTLLNMMKMLNVEEVSRLVQECVDVNAAYKSGRTPLDYAEKNEKLKGTDVYNLLREKTLSKTS